MDTKGIRRFLLVVVVIAVLLVVFGLSRPATPANADNVFSLQSPPFVGIARAETLSATSVITDEAGMSAWFQASTSINLNDVRDVFRTIETETADYIIGSVPVTNYPESDDVHVYVHTDGWILAYYLAPDPVGKIFDWRAYHDGGRASISTKLENTIALLASEAGVVFSNATYYNFRYPNATHLMLIVEWVYSGTDSCEINLPGSFAYYERSWSLGGDTGGWDSWYKVDGMEVHRWSGYHDWHTAEGTLTPTQLPPDQPHWIEIGVEGSIFYVSCLVYLTIAVADLPTEPQTCFVYLTSLPATNPGTLFAPA